ncbi:MAG TPA: WD40 repeat domain-containing protein, partial [Myxococcales bacterium]|nr:WD40 repeat domain-containing protein [Myxococcales bacterium]
KIATGSVDGTVCVRSADGSGASLVIGGPTYSDKSAIFSIAFSPDGSKIATGSQAGNVTIWSASSSEPLIMREWASGSVWSVAFSPDGKEIASAGDDGMLRIWMVSDSGRSSVLRVSDQPLWSVAFSPDGKKIITGSEDTTARVWSVEDTDTVRAFRGHGGNTLLNAEGSKVLTVAEKVVRVRNVDGSGNEGVIETLYPISASAISPRGKKVAIAQNASVQVWDWDGSDEHELLTGSAEPVTAIAFSDDGQKLVIGFQNGTIHIRRLDGVFPPVVLTKKGTSRDPKTKSSITALALSRDGTIVASGSKDGGVRIWNADGPGEPKVFEGSDGWISSLAISNDGKKILSGAYASARIWDRTTLTDSVVLRGYGERVVSVAFSSDGTKIITGSSDNVTRVWSGDGSGVPLELKGDSLPTSVAFNSDGRVVIAFLDGSIKVSPLESEWLLSLLWRASVPCLGLERREYLLGESSAEARTGNLRCRQEMARRYGWPAPEEVAR